MANKKNGFRNVALALAFASTLALAGGAVVVSEIREIERQEDKQIVEICNQSNEFLTTQTESLLDIENQFKNNQISQQAYNQKTDYFNSINYKRSVVENLSDVDSSFLQQYYTKKDVLRSVGATTVTLGIISSIGCVLSSKKYIDEEKSTAKHQQKVTELIKTMQDIDAKEN